MERMGDAVRLASVDLHSLPTHCKREGHFADGTEKKSVNSFHGSGRGDRRTLLIPSRRSTTHPFRVSVSSHTSDRRNGKRNAEGGSPTTAANKDACLTTVSPSGTSCKWMPSCVTLCKKRIWMYPSTCDSSSADTSDNSSLCVDPTTLANAPPDWEGNGDNHLNNTNNNVAVAAVIGDTERGLKSENVLRTGDVHYATLFHDSKSTAMGRSLRQDHNALDGGSNGINDIDNHNNIYCEAINGSPLGTVFSGNVLQQCGGCPTVNQNQKQEQHFHNQNYVYNYHTLGASRHHHRRRGFGAAAVEAIRSRASAGYVSPQHGMLSPSLKSSKQKRHSFLSGEQDHHVGFQLPLPRSKSGRLNTQDTVTPCETAEVMTTHGIEECDLGNAASAAVGSTGEVDGGSSTYRFSSIAPFYDCAIQQLIIECEMRVASLGEGVSENAMYHQNYHELQQQPPVPPSISTRSFDRRHPELPTSRMFASSSTVSTPLHSFLLPQTRSCGSDVSPQQQQQQQCIVTDGWMNESAVVGSSRSSEPQADVYGGLFSLFSDDLVELGSTGATGTNSAMVHQLLSSIGLHVAYGDAAPMVLISALVYMSRLALQCNSDYAGVTTANWYRLTTTAILIATKMYVDGNRRWNARLAKAAGIPLAEMNRLELDFLFLTDFDLLVREGEVAAWAEWMEAVARRRRLDTPLRTFIFGQSYMHGSLTPTSTATTPLSSCAGEEMLTGQHPLTLTLTRAHTHSICHPTVSANLNTFSPANAPSTPATLTPFVSRTPKLCTTHVSPVVGKAVRGSQRLTASFALDYTEWQQQQCSGSSSLPHPPLSPQQPCDTPNPFPPSPLCAPFPRRGERLFSVVHAPEEPMTPPKLQPTSPMVNTLLTPPEHQLMSPMEFFKRSLRTERSSLAGGSLHRSTLANDTRHCVGTNEMKNDDNFDDDIFDDLRERVKPPHRVLNILSPPTTHLGPLLPPGVERHHRMNDSSNKNNSSSQNKEKPFAAKAVQLQNSGCNPKRDDEAVCSAIEKGINSTHPGTGVRQKNGMLGTVTNASAASETRSIKATTNPGRANGSGWKQVATQVREIFGATRSLVLSSPLNLLRMDDVDNDAASKMGNGHVGVRGNDCSNKHVTHNDDDDDEYGDRNTEFKDDFDEDFEDNLFMRRSFLPSHSPPA